MSLYDILDTPTTSSSLEIQLAYKKRIRKVHPRITRGDEEFLELGKAYCILNDKYKRDFYDTMGDSSLDTLSCDKTAYSIVRIFDRFNNLCYVTFGLLCALNLLSYPIFLQFDKVIYTKQCLCAAAALLLIPIIRNVRRLEYCTFNVLAAVSYRYTFYTIALNINLLLGVGAYIICECVNMYTLGNLLNIDSYITLLINVISLLLIKCCKRVSINVLVGYLLVSCHVIRFRLGIIINTVLLTILSVYFIIILLIVNESMQYITWMLHFMFSCTVIFSLNTLYKCYKRNIPKFSPIRPELDYDCKV